MPQTLNSKPSATPSGGGADVVDAALAGSREGHGTQRALGQRFLFRV